MVDRSPAIRLNARLLLAGLVCAMGLLACTETPAPSASAAPAQSQAEADLRKQARAMTKTILEGALAGGAIGGGISIGLGGDSNDTSTGISIGLGVGATAGTYVAFVQRKYIRRERRLRQIKADLDRNAAEMQTTLIVMNHVLAAQKAELAALRARRVSGQASGEEVARETGEAQANLEQMQIVINGATARQKEFAEARGLTIARRETASPIDGDLAQLAQRIEQMKQVANDLATDL